MKQVMILFPENQEKMMETIVRDEISVRNQVVVTVAGETKFYPVSQLGLSFESSTDVEVLQAVGEVLRESGISFPESSFIVSRAAEGQNFSIFPKTELG
jgi:hypothetical protein